MIISIKRVKRLHPHCLNRKEYIMKIHKTSIRNIYRYLTMMEEGETFRLGVKVSNDMLAILGIYGFDVTSEGQTVCPNPISPSTSYNAHGKTITRRDLPKVRRLVVRYWQLTDKRGNVHSGTWDDYGPFYPKEFLPPLRIPFTLSRGYLHSEVFTFHYNLCNAKRILLATNILLEMFGVCEVLGQDLSSKLPQGRQLDWKILPSGHRSEEEINSQIERFTKRYDEPTRENIAQNHALLQEHHPNFYAYGKDGFNGYIVYGYHDKDKFFLESCLPDNATYILGGDWKKISKLTKQEVIKGKLHVARVFHNDNWERHILNHLREQQTLFS